MGVIKKKYVKDLPLKQRLIVMFWHYIQKLGIALMPMPVGTLLEQVARKKHFKAFFEMDLYVENRLHRKLVNRRFKRLYRKSLQ